jgi:hypothetical protein
MSIVERVKRICLSPDSEWPVIASESTTMSVLITSYVLPLAALSAVAALVGSVLAGFSIIGGLRIAVRSLVMSVVGVVVVSVIIDALAPTFGAEKGSERAAKVAAYSPTPAWVGGVFQVVPFLGNLVALIGALYSLYLLYLGLLRVMRSPQEKVVGYTVVVILCALVIGVVASYISSGVMGTGTPL